MTGIKEIPLESIKHRYLELVSSDLSSKTVLISHFGDLNEAKIEALLKITEETILEVGSKRQMMRRICSLLVEALQNISNHSGSPYSSRKPATSQRHGFVVSFVFTLKCSASLWPASLMKAPIGKKYSVLAVCTLRATDLSAAIFRWQRPLRSSLHYST